MNNVPACGIYDFRYAPYALGDVLTWQVNLLISAAEGEAERTEHIVFAFPHQPAPSFQGHITQRNYRYYLAQLFPAFLCSPSLSSVQVLKDERAFLYLLDERRRQGAPSWPDFRDHKKQSLDFISHRRVNRFFEKHGRIPRLAGPRGLQDWAARFRAQELAGKRLVAINPRQSRLASTETASFRDSPLAEWRRFLEQARHDQPDIVFLWMGQYDEFPASFTAMPNIVHVRRMGYGLGEELALLAGSDGFLGASSGFAAFATFSDRPYTIFNVDPSFAAHAGIPPGAERYPFATDRQKLVWTVETAESLMRECARILE